MDFYEQIIESPREFLIVDRNSNLAEKFRGYNGEYENCVKEDTRISVALFLNLILKMIMDLWSVWRHFRGLDPALFGSLSVLCVKRAMFAAFFSEYRPRFFFGRDDYSKDHIIRNQELRRIGGISLGINHGLPLNTFTPAWQEVDFDIYYAFGSHLFSHTLHKTWPSECIVKPVGSKNMLPKYRTRLKDTRPKDIAFFPIIHSKFEQNMRAVFAVAQCFGDRRIYIKLKGNRRPKQISNYHRLLSGAPANVVVYTDPNPYELLLNVSYSIAFTTLVAESLQFGAITFTLDTDPSIQHLYYRNFPSLLVSDSDDIIARISAIESGQESYDFDNYNELINMDGTDIFQIIRKDIGLIEENSH